MKVVIRTLTPLWTGDIDRDSRSVQATGLLGSLRWWYEGMLRGAGAHACDPTGDTRCQFNSKAFVKSITSGQKSRDGIRLALEAGLSGSVCAACRVFGCTGWRRRFSVHVSGGAPINLHFLVNRPVSRPQAKWLFDTFGREERGGKRVVTGREVSYTFGVRPLWGDLSLTVEDTAVDGGAISGEAVVAYLLEFIEKWGGLGAKTQNGFGQIRLIDKPATWPRLVDRGREWIQELSRLPAQGHGPVAKAFDLRAAFSRTYLVANREPYRGSLVTVGTAPTLPDRDVFLPFAFGIRYKSQAAFRGTGRDVGMRPTLREAFGKTVEQELLGRTRGQEQSGSRIHVSHLHREAAREPYRFRIWGYVPDGLSAENRQPVTSAEVARIIDGYVMQILPGTTIEHRFDSGAGVQ